MKILVVSPISQHAIDELRQSHEVISAFNAPQDEIKRNMTGCDILIFRSGPDISCDVMQCSSNLSLLIRAGSGLDNLDLEYATSNNINLRRIEMPGARAVAELAFALMLTLARQIFRADSLLRKGHWAKHELTGSLLMNKTLGIYGAGNIGSTVGAMGASWGMNVIGCVEKPTETRTENLKSKGIQLTTPDKVLEEADFLSLHVPLQDTTRHLIDRDALSKMKSTAYLINLARGGVVDESALLHALKNQQIAGAGMDVHEREGDGFISPLAELSNVVLTPHIGAGTIDTQYAIGEEVISIVNQHEQER